MKSYTPCAQLAPYLSSLAISEAVDETCYKVLPGEGLVLGFQYKGHLSFEVDGVYKQLRPSGMSGLQDEYRIFRNSRDTGTVLVYFRAGAASAFFSEPLHEIFGQSISLDNLMLTSEVLILEEKICSAKTDARRIAFIESFLISRLKPVPPDILVLSAMQLIYQSKGTIRISELSKKLLTSQSPLEKRFRRVVGASPKKFASIVRFNHIINRYNTGKSLTHLAIDAGYFDQSHFIKEFKRFAGENPRKFFNATD